MRGLGKMDSVAAPANIGAANAVLWRFTGDGRKLSTINGA